MNFEHELYEKCIVVRLSYDRLDSIVAPAFRQSVVELSEEHKKTIIIDLSSVVFMDSSGLGAVIGCYKAAQATGGLSFCNVNESVKEVFALTHMDRIIEIHDDFDTCFSKQAA